MRKQGPKQMKTSLAWGAFLAVLLALACPAARSQWAPYPTDNANRPASMPGDPGALGNYDPVVAARRQAALNAERQKQLASDTNKLLKLAQELNDDVTTTGTKTFTPEQLHRLSEIEKLAHNIRYKMVDIPGQPSPSFSPMPGSYPPQ